MSDWAPYQSTDPEAQRSTLRSPPPGASLLSPRYDSSHSNPWGESRSYSPSNVIQPENAGPSTGGFGGNREFVNQFDTSLPLRMDVEAALAYLVLPPAGGVVLLLLEHNSDYVRFFSWVIFVVDIGLMGYLSVRAYRDADTLDRFEIPYFGAWASSFVDEE
ncbi:hypothetical protein ABW19_dt0209547 [Dactylella cylindrospora]|nr:hypothetical protein ABW19_dt0209547 [Dactylella cylindrospora]